MDDTPGDLTLEPLSEAGIRRVLVVVAHPDDAEYGTSAAVAHWTSQGIDVAYLLLTAGEAGMQRSRKRPDRCVPKSNVRHARQWASSG